MMTPEPEPEVNVPNPTPEDLVHPWTLHLAAPFIRIVFPLFLKFKFKAPVRYLHRQNVPRQGGLLIFANHLSNTDPVLVQLACPRLINFMSRRELFARPDIGKFIRWWRAFPVTQSSADTAAIKTAIKLAQNGHAVCMFPEGQLSPDGRLLPLFAGAALLVRKSQVPCICVGLQNTDKLMPHPEITARPAHATLTARWGEPRSFDAKANPQEILSWIESELLTLSNQPPKQQDAPEADTSEASLP